MKLSASRKKRLKEKYGDWAIVTEASSGIGFELAAFSPLLVFPKKAPRR